MAAFNSENPLSPKIDLLAAEEATQRGYEVFISYAREDEAAAVAVVERLREWGINCWIDRDTVKHKPGEQWAEEIVSAIKQCRIMVVVFSRHANASRYVKSEVHKAFDTGLRILPFRIENVAPEGAYELHLPQSQWLDAFPRPEQHLNTLAEKVCDLLAGVDTGPPPADTPPSDDTTHATPRVKKLFALPLRLMPWRRRDTAVNGVGAAPPPAVHPPLVRDYRERKELREAASSEDPVALAQDGRWWHIKLIRDSLVSHAMPLGRFAETSLELERRLKAFSQVRPKFDEALKRLGAPKAMPYIDQLRTIISDHPDLPVLENRIRDLSEDHKSLQATIDGLTPQNRWTGIENALRRFVMKHQQATRSVLLAAEKASAHALGESRRLDLITWTIAAGAAILASTYCVEYGLGLQKDFPRWEQKFGLLGELALSLTYVLVRFGTVATTLGFMLAAFGVHHQGVFAGTSIALMACAAVLQVIPHVASRMPRDGASLPALLAFAFYAVPAASFAAALMMTMHLATRRLLSKGPVWPGVVPLAAAFLCGLGFIPSSGLGSSFEYYHEIVHWLPDGCLCAGLLAVFGLITSRVAWCLPIALVLGAGTLMQNDRSAISAIVILLVVTSWIATQPKTIRGHLLLLAITVMSCFVVEATRSIEGQSEMLGYGTLAPLLGLWGVACGGIALLNTSLLGPPIVVTDMIAKQALRLQATGTTLAARALADTVWFRQGLEWHKKRDPVANSASQPRGRPVAPPKSLIGPGKPGPNRLTKPRPNGPGGPPKR